MFKDDISKIIIFSLTPLKINSTRSDLVDPN